MKKLFLFLLSGIFLFCSYTLSAQTIINVLDEVLFYDGYASLEKLENEIEPVPGGVIRHSSSLMATKLSDSQIALFGDTITLEVIIKAACDNYDRIGNVNLALVPKGYESYETTDSEVIRQEIARFITPFMNKNRQPDTVPYLFDVSNLKDIFHDEIFQREYDYWIELEVFGVPYVANTEVAGCSGRNDVFYGTLNFLSSTPTEERLNNNLFIKFFSKNKFNNYQEGATDELGKTVKSVEFILEKDVTNAQLYLITSNHGAQSRGEEYNRRMHYVYFDNEEVLKYRPGRTSCEPFRIYNTQGNGIYGKSPMSDTQWQSFSNWCPGDVIDIRVISLGNLTAGKHSFKIDVPDAMFRGDNGAGTNGNFPLTLYMQGKIEGESSVQNLSINNMREEKTTNILLYPNPAKTSFSIESNLPVKNVVIYNISGQKVFQGNSSSVNVEKLKTGVYTVRITLADKSVSIQKIIKQ